MQKLALTLFLLTLTAASLPGQTTSDTDRFVSRNLNFSIVTPDSEWKWAPLADHESDANIWIVTKPGGDERFSVSVSAVGQYRLNEAWITDILHSLMQDGVRNGYHVEHFKFRNSTAPIFPSYTYSYTRVGHDGDVSYVDGYIAAVGRIYTLQYASRERNEEERFRRFVGTFQVADKWEGQRGSREAPWGNSFPGISAIGMQASLGRPLAPNGVQPTR